MTLSEILPTVNQLSLAVAKEEGYSLETSDAENILLNQLASTSATIWSPQADNRSIQALSDLLATAKEQSNA